MVENIPQQIKNLLTEDESVESLFDLKGCQLYATSERLLMTKGKNIRDFDYAYISSVAYRLERYWQVAVIGIAMMAAGGLLVLFTDTPLTPLLAIIGVICGLLCIIAGILIKSEWVEINVVGLSKPIKCEGTRQDLDCLSRLVRQKRGNG